MVRSKWRFSEWPVVVVSGEIGVPLDIRWELRLHRMSMGSVSSIDYLNSMAKKDPKTDLLQGTLDLLILRVLNRGEMHGWGIADRICQLSKQVLSVGEGSLYPALYRMEQQGWIDSEWGTSENNRKAKFYRLTQKGRRQLEVEKETWERLTDAISAVMRSA